MKNKKSTTVSLRIIESGPVMKESFSPLTVYVNGIKWEIYWRTLGNFEIG
jgi:hypothetical protein